MAAADYHAGRAPGSVTDREKVTGRPVSRLLAKMDALGAVYSATAQPNWFQVTYTLPGDHQPLRYACSVDDPLDAFEREMADAIRQRLNS